MVDMKCKCGKKWDYKGKQKTYAICPDCKKIVKLNKKSDDTH
jgi:hypothetical protein